MNQKESNIGFLCSGNNELQSQEDFQKEVDKICAISRMGQKLVDEGKPWSQVKRILKKKFGVKCEWLFALLTFPEQNIKETTRMPKTWITKGYRFNDVKVNTFDSTIGPFTKKQILSFDTPRDVQMYAIENLKIDPKVVINWWLQNK